VIYNSLKDISAEFEVFLFDAFGVFWEGNDFYPNSLSLMKGLKDKGKTVVVISNSPEKIEDATDFYNQRGLFKGCHYDYLVTSGNLVHEKIKAGKITFESFKNPKKYFVIGDDHEIFADSIYEQVYEPETADFIYCGTPYVFKDDIENYPQYKKFYWPTKLDENGEICAWNTETVEPFWKRVEEISKLHKPILNPNPDFTAKVGHKMVPGSEAVFVVRNGTIAEMFRKKGLEVYEFGKPHANIFEYTFGILQNDGISIDKKRCCMIGDTVRTDIKGAINAGIVPVLCVETGVTAEAVLNGQSVESICFQEGIELKQIVQIKSIAGD
jgi:HAD superfamily hydrolase (TIGR01450 family)